MSWGGLPFSLTQAGAVNTNRFTASSNGTLNLYLQEKSAKGFYMSPSACREKISCAVKKCQRQNQILA